MRRCIFALMLFQALAFGQQSDLDQGIAAFRSEDYERALDLFPRAENIHPNQAAPHAYLGATYSAMASQSAMAAVVLQSPQSDSLSDADRSAMIRARVPVAEMERLAESEFRRALALDPNNSMALQSLMILLSHGETEFPAAEKSRRLAEAGVLHDRLAIASADESLRRLNQALPRYRESVAAGPDGRTLIAAGELIRSGWSGVMERAKASPLDTGPLPNPMRQVLQLKFTAIINEGLKDFERALEIDPANEHAMIGMGYLIRDRAVLGDTQQEYDADVATGSAWVNRGLDVRAQASPVAARPTAIGSDRQPRLIRRVTPSYPAAAIQDRVTGSVGFKVTIGREGRATVMTPVSGNPILFDAAQSALKQWIWSPGMVNGNPAEVQIEVEVRFSANR